MQKIVNNKFEWYCLALLECVIDVMGVVGVSLVEVRVSRLPARLGTITPAL